MNPKPYDKRTVEACIRACKGVKFRYYRMAMLSRQKNDYSSAGIWNGHASGADGCMRYLCKHLASGGERKSK